MVGNELFEPNEPNGPPDHLIREINLLVWILTVLFILRYIYLAAA